jgi:hypothetical protein
MLAEMEPSFKQRLTDAYGNDPLWKRVLEVIRRQADETDTAEERAS